jgi:cysteine sulfinate desulfinase/cysteine desulfurase-like protein
MLLYHLTNIAQYMKFAKSTLSSILIIFHLRQLPLQKIKKPSIPRKLKNAVTENTKLVSIMHVNNEIGAINDIKTIGSFCRSKNILFHTDAVQSFTKLPIDVKAMNIDLLSASSHKIYGPKGVGMLYIRKKVEILPNQYGGHQESNMRTGTENLPGIVGFAKAAEISHSEMSEEIPGITGFATGCTSSFPQVLTALSSTAILRTVTEEYLT